MEISPTEWCLKSIFYSIFICSKVIFFHIFHAYLLSTDYAYVPDTVQEAENVTADKKPYHLSPGDTFEQWERPPSTQQL